MAAGDLEQPPTTLGYPISPAARRQRARMKPGPPGPPGPPGLPVSGGGDGEGRVGSGGRWQLHRQMGEDCSLLPPALDMVLSHLPVLLVLVLYCPKVKLSPPAPVPAAGPCWHRSLLLHHCHPPKLKVLN